MVQREHQLKTREKIGHRDQLINVINSVSSLSLRTHVFVPILTLHFVTLPWKPWPEEALERVANSFLGSLEMSENERREVIPICKTFHTSAQQLSDRYNWLFIFKCNVYKSLITLLFTLQISLWAWSPYLCDTHFLLGANCSFPTAAHSEKRHCHESQTEVYQWPG